MPTHRQTVVEVPVTTRGPGSCDTAQLQASYPGSPMNELNDQLIKEMAQEMLLDGLVNDAGHTFGEFNRDYSGAPTIAGIDQDGGGLPLPSGWVPNVTSPGAGSLSPTDQPAPPDGFGQTPADNWGTGVGSQLEPSDSSTSQSGHTIGDYVMGRSS